MEDQVFELKFSWVSFKTLNRHVRQIRLQSAVMLFILAYPVHVYGAAFRSAPC